MDSDIKKIVGKWGPVISPMVFDHHPKITSVEVYVLQDVCLFCESFSTISPDHSVLKRKLKEIKENINLMNSYKRGSFNMRYLFGDIGDSIMQKYYLKELRNEKIESLI